MLTDLRSRLAALCLLLGLLSALLVAHGAVEPDPAHHDYPENEDLIADYDRYAGSGVVVGGRIVSTDPVVMRGENDLELTLTGIDDEVEAGDLVWLYGTARPDRTVAVETAVVRSDWEIWYMYVVSALGGLLTLGRFLDGWRLDRERWAFVPRESPLSARVLDDTGGTVAGEAASGSGPDSVSTTGAGPEPPADETGGE